MAAQPGTFESLNSAPGAPAAENLRPSRMPVPRTTHRRPSPSDPVTANEFTAADIIDRSSTCTQTPVLIDAKQPKEEITPLQVTPSPPRFGEDMAVMMFRQGLKSPSGTFTITFDLDDDTLYLQVAQWAKCKSSSPTDLEQSICVSFACYHLSSFLPNLPEDDQTLLFGKLTLHSQCSWPTSGNLSLETKRDGKNFAIPLAPPIFFTLDDCVNVSALIRSGENTFSVVQQSNMSQHVFMLHAHHPTYEQFSYLASCRHRCEDWSKTIHALFIFESTELQWKRLPSSS